jgi:hypothetical protein
VKRDRFRFDDPAAPILTVRYPADARRGVLAWVEARLARLFRRRRPPARFEIPFHLSDLSTPAAEPAPPDRPTLPRRIRFTAEGGFYFE